MLLHINGKFTVGILKSSILSCSFVLNRPSLLISRCSSGNEADLAVSGIKSSRIGVQAVPIGIPNCLLKNTSTKYNKYAANQKLSILMISDSDNVLVESELGFFCFFLQKEDVALLKTKYLYVRHFCYKTQLD